MSKKLGPLVSVIVPIYNTQEFLPRCLDSILGQTYANMEVILINDGSTDASLSICEKYAADDGRVHIISQPNQGIIAAKKAGLKICRGDYITFVDSDDWVEPELLEKLVEKMQDSDCGLVCTNVYWDQEDGVSMEFKNAIPPGIYEAQSIAKNLFYYKNTDDYGILPYSVAKLYPKDMLCEVLDHIEGNIRYAEDKAIVFSFVFRNIRVCFTDDVLYHYYIRKGSVCRSENPDYLVELTAVYKYIKKIFETQKEREHLLWQLGKWLWKEAGYAINTKLGLAAPGNPIHREPYKLDPSVFLPQKKRVILYGAGKVGADYRKQLTECAGIELCGWVDKEYEKYREKELDVQPVAYIKETKCDYVLVAVWRQTVFGEIKKELAGMGIAGESIIWGRPYGAPDEKD